MQRAEPSCAVFIYQARATNQAVTGRTKNNFAVSTGIAGICYFFERTIQPCLIRGSGILVSGTNCIQIRRNSRINDKVGCSIAIRILVRLRDFCIPVGKRRCASSQKNQHPHRS
jgi:hypothetical protein